MKIAMLLGNGSSSAILANAVRAWYPDAELLLVLERQANKQAMLLHRSRRLGTSVVIGQLLFQSVIVPLIRLRSNKRIGQIISEYNLNSCRQIFDGALEVPNINDSQPTELLRKFSPDVVLVNGTRIIKPNVLSCVNAAFINTHVGITPMYRGVHGGYWALWNNDPENFGVTIHLVDPGVDTGQPLCQVRLRPTPDDTFVTYPILQQALALAAIKEILSDLSPSLTKKKEKPVTNNFSRQWFHPTAGQYLRGLLRGVK
jgi:folate-dependent phosphoribosylglycinamide formyltransferase PurN